MTQKFRSVAVVGALALTMGWTMQQAPTTTAPLTYEHRVVDGRRLLALDEGSDRVVEAFGDVTNADSIVVFVPGAGWNLRKFEQDDTPMSPRTAARDLMQRTEREDGTRVTTAGPDTDVTRLATVAWLGYQPPPGLGVGALRSERADVGAAELARFVEWLPEDASITLACHSYGGVVCGQAAAANAQVDNIVSIGGAGMDVSSVEQLDTAANVWVAQAPEDNIRFLPGFRIAGFGHGSSPVADGFGGYQVDTGDAREHADYYQPDGSTMTHLLSIAQGRYAEVDHA